MEMVNQPDQHQMYPLFLSLTKLSTFSPFLERKKDSNLSSAAVQGAKVLLWSGIPAAILSCETRFLQSLFHTQKRRMKIMESEWSELFKKVPESTGIIVQQLAFEDILNVGQVCKTWRSVILKSRDVRVDLALNKENASKWKDLSVIYGHQEIECVLWTHMSVYLGFYSLQDDHLEVTKAYIGGRNIMNIKIGHLKTAFDTLVGEQSLEIAASLASTNCRYDISMVMVNLDKYSGECQLFDQNCSAELNPKFNMCLRMAFI